MWYLRLKDEVGSTVYDMRTVYLSRIKEWSNIILNDECFGDEWELTIWHQAEDELPESFTDNRGEYVSS